MEFFRASCLSFFLLLSLPSFPTHNFKLAGLSAGNVLNETMFVFAPRSTGFAGMFFSSASWGTSEVWSGALAEFHRQERQTIIGREISIAENNMKVVYANGHRVCVHSPAQLLAVSHAPATNHLQVSVCSSLRLAGF